MSSDDGRGNGDGRGTGGDGRGSGGSAQCQLVLWIALNECTGVESI